MCCVWVCVWEHTAGFDVNKAERKRRIQLAKGSRTKRGAVGFQNKSYTSNSTQPHTSIWSMMFLLYRVLEQRLWVVYVCAYVCPHVSQLLGWDRVGNNSQAERNHHLKTDFHHATSHAATPPLPSPAPGFPAKSPLPRTEEAGYRCLAAAALL